MAGIGRVTEPLLDVLEVLLEAYGHNDELHGWAIMRSVHRSGPTVYGVLDRLEDMDWVMGHWEARNPDPSKPPRRLYRFTGGGVAAAETLLAERRPTRVAGRTVASRPLPGTARGAEAFG